MSADILLKSILDTTKESAFPAAPCHTVAASLQACLYIASLCSPHGFIHVLCVRDNVILFLTPEHGKDFKK